MIICGSERGEFCRWPCAFLSRFPHLLHEVRTLLDFHNGDRVVLQLLPQNGRPLVFCVLVELRPIVVVVGLYHQLEGGRSTAKPARKRPSSAANGILGRLYFFHGARFLLIGDCSSLCVATRLIRHILVDIVRFAAFSILCMRPRQIVIRVASIVLDVRPRQILIRVNIIIRLAADNFQGTFCTGWLLLLRNFLQNSLQLGLQDAAMRLVQVGLAAVVLDHQLEDREELLEEILLLGVPVEVAK